MWQACSQNFQIRFSQIPQRIRWPLCDCYLDYLRDIYDAGTVKNLSDKEAEKLGVEIAEVCEMPEELPEKSKILPELTTWNSYLVHILRKLLWLPGQSSCIIN